MCNWRDRFIVLLWFTPRIDEGKQQITFWNHTKRIFYRYIHTLCNLLWRLCYHSCMITIPVKNKENEAWSHHRIVSMPSFLTAALSSLPAEQNTVFHALLQVFDRIASIMYVCCLRTILVALWIIRLLVLCISTEEDLLRPLGSISIVWSMVLAPMPFFQEYLSKTTATSSGLILDR